MGFKEDIDLDSSVSPPSSPPSLTLTDALLFATMYIVGLPVDVQVKDGSIYSGIFHTASVHNDYGIVLKKAKMIKKGSKEANLVHGAVIDTLVVLPGDLIQVIAKGVMLPADGINGNQTGNDVEAVSGLLQPLQCQKPKVKMTKSGKATPEAFTSKRHKSTQTRLMVEEAQARLQHRGV